MFPAAVARLTAGLSADARPLLRRSSVDPTDFHASLHRHLGAIGRTLRSTRPGVPVHAALCVLTDGRGVLAAGDTGTGKSTLVGLLGTRAGATFVSDDTVWLEGRRATGFGAPLAIRSSSPFASQARTTPFAAGADRVMAAAADLGIEAVQDHATIDLVLFPSFEPGGPSCRPMPAVEGFCRLVGSLLRSCSDDELLVLARLAAQCPSTAIGYHDEASCLSMCEEAFASASAPTRCAPVPSEELIASGFLPDVRAIRLGDDVAAWSPTNRQIVAVHGWPAGTSLPEGAGGKGLAVLGFVRSRTTAST